MNQLDLFEPEPPELTEATHAILLEYWSAAREQELPVDARLRHLAQLAALRGVEVVAHL